MKLANHIRQKTLPGQCCLGTFLVELRAPGVPVLLKQAGFDFFMIDTEHGHYSSQETTALILAGKNCGLCPIVRVSEPTHGKVVGILDAGAEGIMIPMIRTMDQVHQAVAESKYPPMGARGVHFLRPATGFIVPAGDGKDYMNQTNRSIITAGQIATLEAVELIEDIAAAEGIDMIYLGPSDLSIAMGHCQEDHPSVMKVVERIGTACKKHGKIAGAHFGTLELAQQLLDRGVTLLGYVAAGKLLLDAASAAVENVKKSRGTTE